MSNLKEKMLSTLQQLSSGLRPASVCALMLFAGLNTATATAGNNGPAIYTNESFINALEQKSKLDISDQKAVLKHILDSLPDEVTVYPTEGYYYFSFYHDKVKYAGNIRLDYGARQKGEIFFNYFKATNGWSYEEKDHFVTLGKKDGVTVEKVKELSYRVGIKGRNVLFNLIDLSSVKPADNMIRKDEEYIGPVYDESGVRFFLVFNPKIKIFHYILDETNGSPDELLPLKGIKDVTIGRRTGFAYYNDTKYKRKLLVGVNDENSSVNNYYDGPFDQLPDSFIKGDALKNAILQQAPDLKGKIDRFGNFEGEERRYLIAPYMYYRAEQELSFFSECITKKITPDMYQCFLAPRPDEEGEEEQPEPQKDAKAK